MKLRNSVIAAAALLAGGCNAVLVPDSIRPADERLAWTVAATGVQIYECRSAKAGFAWAFVAPEATLFDQRGRPIGTHGAGPFWQAHDGSRVVGSVKARADATAANAIPWLLLQTKSTAVAGSFSAITSIQRINTSGGIAPVDGCSATTAGVTRRVPYSADYVFFTQQGRSQ